MKDDILYKVALDLFSIPPLILRSTRKKVIKSTLADMEVNMSHLNFEIIKLLKEEGTLHAAEIGKRLHIAKAEMTKLIDKLVEMKIVVREADSCDRRITNISLSAYGKKIMEENRQRIIKDIREAIANLNDEDINSMSVSLRKLKAILSKLN